MTGPEGRPPSTAADPPEGYERCNRYTRVIVDEAQRRGIAVEIRDPGRGELVLRHHGRSITTFESLSELTSAVALRICSDKALTRRVLADVGLPVAPGQPATNPDADRHFLAEHGEVVVKPIVGEGGAGITVGVRDEAALEAAIGRARAVHPDVLLEACVTGEDLRVVVIGDAVVAASVRRPPEVVGDGRSTLAALVADLSDRRAAETDGAAHVPLDAVTLDVLAAAGLGPDDVLDDGRVLAVRRTANVHTGGTIHDITDHLHPTHAALALAVAAAVDIPVVGVDLFVDAIDRAGAVVIEANEQPGLANHEPQPTVERFVDLLFPDTATDRAGLGIDGARPVYREGSRDRGGPMTIADDPILLPDPEPAQVRYTIISVDDHLVEPPDMFEGRLPAALQDRAPKVITNERGHEVWEFEGQTFTQVGMNAVAGRTKSMKNLEPTKFSDMRPGCWDIHERIRDMDLNGVWASVNFPSMITGFCGRVFAQAQDPELGWATTQAWNDWLHDEWWSPYPERIVPLGITYLSDAEKGAAEIRRNAARGFTAVTLPERPHRIGLPSLFSGYWDPIIQACADTDTVIALHVGSSGGYESPEGAPSLQLGATMFGQLSLAACAEWLWSGYAVKHPNLKIAMSEGGIGWVAMLLDRLDNIVDRSGYGLGWETRPAEVLKRNFWFCTIDDPSTIVTRHRIGVENIMFETDYPHGDGTWPDTQDVVEDVYGHLPDDELRLILCENAAKVFRHPLPAEVLPKR